LLLCLTLSNIGRNEGKW